MIACTVQLLTVALLPSICLFCDAKSKYDNKNNFDLHIRRNQYQKPNQLQSQNQPQLYEGKYLHGQLLPLEGLQLPHLQNGPSQQHYHSKLRSRKLQNDIMLSTTATTHNTGPDTTAEVVQPLETVKIRSPEQMAFLDSLHQTKKSFSSVGENVLDQIKERENEVHTLQYEEDKLKQMQGQRQQPKEPQQLQQQQQQQQAQQTHNTHSLNVAVGVDSGKIKYHAPYTLQEEEFIDGSQSYNHGPHTLQKEELSNNIIPVKNSGTTPDAIDLLYNPRTGQWIDPLTLLPVLGPSAVTSNTSITPTSPALSPPEPEPADKNMTLLTFSPKMVATIAPAQIPSKAVITAIPAGAFMTNTTSTTVTTAITATTTTTTLHSMYDATNRSIPPDTSNRGGGIISSGNSGPHSLQVDELSGDYGIFYNPVTGNILKPGESVNSSYLYYIRVRYDIHSTDKNEDYYDDYGTYREKDNKKKKTKNKVDSSPKKRKGGKGMGMKKHHRGKESATEKGKHNKVIYPDPDDPIHCVYDFQTLARYCQANPTVAPTSNSWKSTAYKKSSKKVKDSKKGWSPLFPMILPTVAPAKDSYSSSRAPAVVIPKTPTSVPAPLPNIPPMFTTPASLPNKIVITAPPVLVSSPTINQQTKVPLPSGSNVPMSMASPTGVYSIPTVRPDTISRAPVTITIPTSDRDILPFTLRPVSPPNSSPTPFQSTSDTPSIIALSTVPSTTMNIDTKVPGTISPTLVGSNFGTHTTMSISFTTMPSMVNSDLVTTLILPSTLLPSSNVNGVPIIVSPSSDNTLFPSDLSSSSTGFTPPPTLSLHSDTPSAKVDVSSSPSLTNPSPTAPTVIVSIPTSILVSDNPSVSTSTSPVIVVLSEGEYLSTEAPTVELIHGIDDSTESPTFDIVHGNSDEPSVNIDAHVSLSPWTSKNFNASTTHTDSDNNRTVLSSYATVRVVSMFDPWSKSDEMFDVVISGFRTYCYEELLPLVVLHDVNATMSLLQDVTSSGRISGMSYTTFYASFNAIFHVSKVPQQPLVTTRSSLESASLNNIIFSNETAKQLVHNYFSGPMKTRLIERLEKADLPIQDVTVYSSSSNASSPFLPEDYKNNSSGNLDVVVVGNTSSYNTDETSSVPQAESTKDSSIKHSGAFKAAGISLVVVVVTVGLVFLAVRHKEHHHLHQSDISEKKGNGFKIDETKAKNNDNTYIVPVGDLTLDQSNFYDSDAEYSKDASFITDSSTSNGNNINNNNNDASNSNGDGNTSNNNTGSSSSSSSSSSGCSNSNITPSTDSSTPTTKTGAVTTDNGPSQTPLSLYNQPTRTATPCVVNASSLPTLTTTSVVKNAKQFGWRSLVSPTSSSLVGMNNKNHKTNKSNNDSKIDTNSSSKNEERQPRLSSWRLRNVKREHRPENFNPQQQQQDLILKTWKLNKTSKKLSSTTRIVPTLTLSSDVEVDLIQLDDDPLKPILATRNASGQETKSVTKRPQSPPPKLEYKVNEYTYSSNDDDHTMSMIMDDDDEDSNSNNYPISTTSSYMMADFDMYQRSKPTISSCFPGWPSMDDVSVSTPNDSIAANSSFGNGDTNGNIDLDGIVTGLGLSVDEEDINNDHQLHSSPHQPKETLLPPSSIETKDKKTPTSPRRKWHLGNGSSPKSSLGSNEKYDVIPLVDMIRKDCGGIATSSSLNNQNNKDNQSSKNSLSMRASYNNLNAFDNEQDCGSVSSAESTLDEFAFIMNNYYGMLEEDSMNDSGKPKSSPCSTSSHRKRALAISNNINNNVVSEVAVQDENTITDLLDNNNNNTSSNNSPIIDASTPPNKCMGKKFSTISTAKKTEVLLNTSTSLTSSSRTTRSMPSTL